MVSFGCFSFLLFFSAKSSSGDGWKRGNSLIAAQLTTRRAPQNLTDDDSTHIKSDNLFRLIFDYRFDAFLSTLVRVEFFEEEKLFSCFFFGTPKKITFHCEEQARFWFSQEKGEKTFLELLCAMVRSKFASSFELPPTPNSMREISTLLRRAMSNKYYQKGSRKKTE